MEKVNISRIPGVVVPFDFDELEGLARDQMFGMSNPGICRACGETREGCEPDAEKYECYACGAFEVDGAEQLFMEVA